MPMPDIDRNAPAATMLACRTSTEGRAAQEAIHVPSEAEEERETPAPILGVVLLSAALVWIVALWLVWRALP